MQIVQVMKKVKYLKKGSSEIQCVTALFRQNVVIKHGHPSYI